MAINKVRVGVVGLGQISYFHEAAYGEVADSCEIVAMCDLDSVETASRAAFHDAQPYTRYQDLLDDPRVDLVDVLVPHALHYEIALAAIEKGKHVLVEKPLAARSDHGRHLIDRAREAGVHLGVAENTRYVTAYQKAAEILRAGTLGDVWIVRTLVGGSEVPRVQNPDLWPGKAPYGGVVLDSAVHSFYLLKWLFGGVDELFGIVSRLVPQGEMEDNALVLGHLANGAEFQAHVSCTMEMPWTERLEVYGSHGALIVDQLVDPVVRLYHGSQDTEGTVIEGVPHDPRTWKFNSIVAEIADFVAALREGRPPLIDPEDALYALRAVEAVEWSVTHRQSMRVQPSPPGETRPEEA